MLREEQIDLRRHRARQGSFHIDRPLRGKVFGEYRVTNPRSGQSYTVTVRGFETGDNACSCPDFQLNTLGTCKHVEAVLEELKPGVSQSMRRRKATIAEPELILHYGEQLQVELLTPARRSDALDAVRRNFFDGDGLFTGNSSYEQLIMALGAVPEQVLVHPDVYDFIEAQNDRRNLAEKEIAWRSACMRGIPPAELESLVHRPLFAYQWQGALFLACRRRAILGDDMGLGKTIQALAAAEILARIRSIRRVLIVAPASVKYQWENDIRTHTDRDVCLVDGQRDSRVDDYTRQTFFTLVHYEQVVRDADLLAAQNYDLIILDEAQRIRNWETKTARTIKRLKSTYAFALTGTPLENNLEELFSIVQFVDPRALGPAFQFLEEYRTLDAEGKVIGYRNLDTLRQRLSPLFLRRTRAEVLHQLPQRSDKTIRVELSAAQKTAYREQEAALARLLAKNERSEIDRQRVLACLVNLRLIASALELYDAQQSASPKLDEVMELLPGLLGDGGHKIVVFSQWERLLRLLAERLDGTALPYVLHHGGLAAAARKDVIERFRNDPACRIFLSTDAGATGLNLQAADTLVNLDCPWNPAILEQRIARVHRLGQAQPVRVLHFITRDTIEERIAQIVAGKRELFAGVFEGEAGEIAVRAFDQADLVQTLREMTAPEPAPAPAEPPPAVPLAEVFAALVQTVQLWQRCPDIPPAWKERLLQALNTEQPG
jgi:SNF2 family DNA or RNA helicase